MNTSKLKSLNQSITSILQPRFGNPVMLNCQNDLSMQMNSYTACPLCEETRRQNYKLKQQLLIVEDQDETINNLKAELEATKQLLELRGKQIDLLRRKLQQSEIMRENQCRQEEQRVQQQVDYLEKLLGKQGQSQKDS